MKRKLRMGMVGGGRDAFIGPIHRIAATMDNKIELVCGAFSSSPKKSQLSGKDLLLPASRIYNNYEEMFLKESKLPQNKKMDFVSIVTPNNMHYPIAMNALEHGFHVVCDKPMTINIEEAKNLRKKVQSTNKLFCLTHNYTGTPMVKEAREMIINNQLGTIRRVVAEYPQGWLSENIEQEGQKQASWRTNPEIAGLSSCMGDIGTHCENLIEYITGLQITELCADLTTFVKGRGLDDDGSILLKLGKKTRGILWASQIAIGEENGLNIRVYGEKGSLEWHQKEPNTLLVHWLNKPTELKRTATPFVGKTSISNTRLPAGHPEGYIEAFANIYNNFANALSNEILTKTAKSTKYDYPNVDDGLRGMLFLDAVIRSNKNEKKWTKITK